MHAHLHLHEAHLLDKKVFHPYIFYQHYNKNVNQKKNCTCKRLNLNVPHIQFCYKKQSFPFKSKKT